VNWVTTLDLRKNLLQGVPFTMLRFRSLTHLDLSHNLIEADSVPVHLQWLSKLKLLTLEENPFVNGCDRWPPASWDWAQPQQAFERMRTLGEEKVPCDQLKAIVVGQVRCFVWISTPLLTFRAFKKEGVGKSTLIDTLCRSLNDESAMKHKFAKWRKRILERREGRHWTDGIDLLQATLPNPDPQGVPLTLTLWDFAGQAVYYPTHQFFLPEHAIFVVAFDLTSSSSVGRVHYW
jgi:hypothetical protein